MPTFFLPIRYSERYIYRVCYSSESRKPTLEFVPWYRLSVLLLLMTEWKSLFNSFCNKFVILVVFWRDSAIKLIELKPVASNKNFSTVGVLLSPTLCYYFAWIKKRSSRLLKVEFFSRKYGQRPMQYYERPFSTFFNKVQWNFLRDIFMSEGTASKIWTSFGL